MSAPNPNDLVAGRYRRRALVGRGGMGTVWEAWDELLDRRVALKQLDAPPGLSRDDARLADARAMREARVAARLSHRNAVPVFDVVEHEGRPCIVMPFVPSATLAEVLREGGPLRVDEAAQVGAQVAAALAAAHTAGIVHRDVKPGNILIADDGAALISDFGIAHALGDVTLTSAGEVHGTPAYLAPEVARGGQATAASDVFSLGATLYAAVEGRPPFGADTNPVALLVRVATEPVPAPERAGPLTPLLTAMLATGPADRPTMAAVASRLRALTGESTGGPEPAAAAVGGRPDPVAITGGSGRGAAGTGPAGRRPPRRPARVLAAVAALVVAGVLAGIGWVQLDRSGGALAGGGRSPQPSASAAPPSRAGTSDPTSAGPSSSAPAPGSSGSGSATDGPTPKPPERSTVAPPPTRAPEPTPEPSAPRTTERAAPSETDLARAVSDYYGLLPGDTDQGWSRLTASYQRGEARSRSYYESFWNRFRAVEVSDVTGSPPDRAEATLTYRYKTGRVDVERREFRFVEEDGRLKISRSSVVGRGDANP